MAETDPMSIDERRKYLHKMRIRYWQAKGKKERSRLLDEMQAVTGLHRKSLLRLIHGELARKSRRKQRSKTYGAEVGAAIRKIAESLDYPCAERLKPSLVRMAEHLEAHGELHLTPEVRRQLETISISSIRRLPRSERSTQRIAHRRGLPRQTFAQKQCIPMRRIDWAERRPGHFEVTWCITVVSAPMVNTSIPCNCWMWPPVGASAWPSWGVPTWSCGTASRGFCAASPSKSGNYTPTMARNSSTPTWYATGGTR